MNVPGPGSENKWAPRDRGGHIVCASGTRPTGFVEHSPPLPLVCRHSSTHFLPRFPLLRHQVTLQTSLLRANNLSKSMVVRAVSTVPSSIQSRRVSHGRPPPPSPIASSSGVTVRGHSTFVLCYDSKNRLSSLTQKDKQYRDPLLAMCQCRVRSQPQPT